MDTSIIQSDPEILGGVACFAGTRVPVKSLFDALKHGRSIDYFLSQFPSVQPDQIAAVLQRASEYMSTPGHAA